MLRLPATGSLARTLTVKVPAIRQSYSHSGASYNVRKLIISPSSNSNSKCLVQTHNRPKVILSLPPTSSLLYATKADPPLWDKHDPEADQQILAQKIKPHPEEVTASSSVRHVFEQGQGEKEDSNVMTAGIKADLETIKDTFALTEVPKESLYLGAAGILPYAATSLSTVYLAWDINHAKASGSGFLFTPETAHQLLDIVTPIQIGFGAVIISFLGAIHWGLEYAGYGGHHSYKRYMYGVLAPAVAWPTIYMPVEYALISQFLAFNFLYFADARATVRGWFPPWYATYRFVLTFFVGASIVVSLIGRGQIVKHEGHLKSSVDYVKQDRDAQWVALEREEKERRQALVAAEEAEDAEAEDGKSFDLAEDNVKGQEKD